MVVLPLRPVGARPEFRLAPTQTIRQTFLVGSPANVATCETTRSLVIAELLLPELLPDGTKQTPRSVCARKAEAFSIFDSNSRIHTANVCLNRRGHKTGPAKPARSLPRVRLKALLCERRSFCLTSHHLPGRSRPEEWRQLCSFRMPECCQPGEPSEQRLPRHRQTSCYQALNPKPSLT